jgi:integrase
LLRGINRTEGEVNPKYPYARHYGDETLPPARMSKFLIHVSHRGHRLAALFVLAMSTGLRQVELFGLHGPDIDLEKGLISVHRQLTEHLGELSLTPPKSKKGRRTVSLPSLAVEALIDHKARALAERRLDGPVFTAPEGGLLLKSNFQKNEYVS